MNHFKIIENFKKRAVVIFVIDVRNIIIIINVMKYLELLIFFFLRMHIKTTGPKIGPKTPLKLEFGPRQFNKIYTVKPQQITIQ